MLICFIVHTFDLKRECLDYTVNFWHHYISVTYFNVRATLDFPAHTIQKMKFSVKEFFSKCEQIRSSLRIWSHLLI